MSKEKPTEWPMTGVQWAAWTGVSARTAQQWMSGYTVAPAWAVDLAADNLDGCEAVVLRLCSKAHLATLKNQRLRAARRDILDKLVNSDDA